MKKILTLCLFAALAASCAREAQSPEFSELQFIVHSNQAATKTFFSPSGSGNYAANWNKNDQIALFTGEITSNTKPFATLTNTAEDGPLATFEGSAPAAESGTFIAVYPASSFVTAYNGGNLGLTLPALQNTTTGQIDPVADILVSAPCAYSSDGQKAEIEDLIFKRMMSVLKINLTGSYAAGEKVSSLTFTAPADTTLAGRAYVNAAERTVGRKWSISTNEVKVNINGGAQIGQDAIWMIVNPGKIDKTAQVTISAKTSKYDISKTITLTDDMVFPQGNIAVLNLSIAEENCQPATEEDLTGEWLMTAGVEEKWYAARAWFDGFNNLRGQEISVDKDKQEITAAENDHALKMTFTKVKEGEYKDMYTIQDANNAYLAAVGGGNYLKVQETPDVNAYWTVTAGTDGTYSIVAEKSANTQKFLQCNPNNGSPLFSCYTAETSSRSKVRLFPYSWLKRNPFQVTLVDAKDGVLTLKASDTQATVVVHGTVAWEASVSDGGTVSPSSGTGDATLTVTIPENTATTPKSYTVNVSTEAPGVENPEFEFTINQGGVVLEAVYYKVTSVTPGKTYIIATADGVSMVPIASGKNYGYMGKGAVTIKEGGIYDSYPAYEFVFEAVEGGFAIKQGTDGRYVYQTGTYNSFNVDATQKDAYVWTVSFNADETANIVNVGKQKTIQHALNFNNWAAYATVDLTQNKLPMLFEKGAVAPKPVVAGWLEIPAYTPTSGKVFLTHKMPADAGITGGYNGRNWSAFYDKNEFMSYWVAYPLNYYLKQSGTRTDQWGLLDPLLSADEQQDLSGGYKDSGSGWYSRGHQLPSADRLGEQTNPTTFYGTNITPQNNDFNGGVWARLESLVRHWGNSCDTAYVVTGCVINPATTKNVKDHSNRVIKVPEAYYKAILCRKTSGTFGTNGFQAIAFYFNHEEWSASEKSGQQVTSGMALSVDALEQLVGIDFFPALEKVIGTTNAATVEAQDPNGVTWWWN